MLFCLTAVSLYTRLAVCPEEAAIFRKLRDIITQTSPKSASTTADTTSMAPTSPVPALPKR